MYNKSYIKNQCEGVASIFYQNTAEKVNDYLKQLLEERVTQATQVGESYELLWSRITEVSLIGGKRIRPTLAVIGYGQLDDKILPVAAAQELVHIAMLIHDDVIDQDFVRHNHKNINGLYRDSYQEFLPLAQATHYANSAGILAGDLLLSEAYNQLQNSKFDAETKLKMINQLTKSVFEVVGGELLDVEAAFVTNKNFNPMKIYRYKTASYSFMGPLLTGAYCAEVDEDTLVTLESFAELAGIAFQIQDDILGVLGDADKTGKSTTTDLREGKETLLIDLHRKLMAGNAQIEENFMQFGSPEASEEQLGQIAKDIELSGAKDQAEQLAEEYFGRAQERLGQLASGDRKDALEVILNKLRNREK